MGPEKARTMTPLAASIWQTTPKVSEVFFADFAGFFTFGERRRTNKWCPEEDSNLHDLAIAST
jgi:hypothetical protein